MALTASMSLRCVYCGAPVKKPRRGRGEHIVPEIIGGALTIGEVSNRAVCPPCNNGILSVLDKELCSRSHLSMVASQEIDAHLWQAWEVDTNSGYLLLDAKPEWEGVELRRLICYPQITFEHAGPELRGDLEEMLRFGRDNFAKVLTAAARQAFQRYTHGKKGALHFERIESDITSQGYRHPPRIFTRHSIAEIAQNLRSQSFIIRYCTDADRRLALRCLSRFDDPPVFSRWKEKTGTLLPAIGQFFDVGLTVRALLKLGVNLLAAYCIKNPINSDTFPTTISVIRGTTRVDLDLIAANGFVRADDLVELSAVGQCHAFRLVYHDGCTF